MVCETFLVVHTAPTNRPLEDFKQSEPLDLSHFPKAETTWHKSEGITCQLLFFDLIIVARLNFISLLN